MAAFAAAQLPWCDFVETKLDGIVAIAGGRFDLGDKTGADFQHGDRNHFALLGK